MSERFLANENFPKETVDWLRQRGDDVIHAADSLLGAPDPEVLRVAIAEDRVLLTFDRDFGELIFHQRHPAPAGIVLFRLRQQSPAIVLPFLRQFFSAAPCLRGAYTVAAPGHYRQVLLSAGD